MKISTKIVKNEIMFQEMKFYFELYILNKISDKCIKNYLMNVITRGRIREYTDEHPEGKESFNQWYLTTKRSEWKNINELKESFNSVDYVGNDLYVFNIKGNNYRLIARIFFKMQLVYIRFIGTHAEYDKVDLATL